MKKKLLYIIPIILVLALSISLFIFFRQPKDGGTLGQETSYNLTAGEYVYKTMDGDFVMSVKIESLGSYAAIRLKDEDKQIDLAGKEGSTLRLVKENNILSQYLSDDEKAFVLVEEEEVFLSSSFKVGLYSKGNTSFVSYELTSLDKLVTQTIETIDNLRIHFLAQDLIRIEEKGPNGFEDRATFHIEKRPWQGASYTKTSDDEYNYYDLGEYTLRVNKKSPRLKDVDVFKNNERIWRYRNLESNSTWLPDLDKSSDVFAFLDSPRVVPSEDRFMPTKEETDNNGWDLGNDALDIYIFMGQEYRQLRQNFIYLTGPTDLIPLYALGSWNSKFYAYTEESALAVIDDYRKFDIPLDVLVIDTDWRIGASDGYEINTNLFPDMKGFIEKAHKKNVRLMYNDHPSSIDAALSRPEILFRSNGLSLLFDLGIDIWWYDRNWGTSIAPLAGINKEVWGMDIFRDITESNRGNLRPLVMSNFDGIDGGHLNRAPNIAAHRYGVQWTGDTHSNMLESAVKNMLYVGIYGPYPYLSEDLGGHFSRIESTEYVRWMQFGTFSPIYRVHATAGLTRDPWEYGKEALDISRDYLKIRYSLLPLMYTLARENYDTGEPIFRRADLLYPGYEEASRVDQYLLGNNILIAPIYDNSDKVIVPSKYLQTADGKSGLQGKYYANDRLQGDPVFERVDKTIDFSWATGSPNNKVPADNFSVRWTGTITNPTDKAFKLATLSDDGVRLYIDSKLVIDAWGPGDSVVNIASGVIDAGKTYDIKLEFLEIAGNAKFQLFMVPDTGSIATRELWLAPGRWINAFSGQVFEGNKIIEEDFALSEYPIYIKEGSLILTMKDKSYIDSSAFDAIALNIFPEKDMEIVENLYEDDFETTDYKEGKYARTFFSVNTKEENKIKVNISKRLGTYSKMGKTRDYKIRLILTEYIQGKEIESVKVNGKKASYKLIERDSNSLAFAYEGATSVGDLIEISIPASKLNEDTNVEIVFK